VQEPTEKPPLQFTGKLETRLQFTGKLETRLQFSWKLGTRLHFPGKCVLKYMKPIYQAFMLICTAWCNSMKLHVEDSLEFDFII
jgi:hypothetical protein